MERRGARRTSALVLSLALLVACGRTDLPAPTAAVRRDEPPAPSVTATATAIATARPTPTPQPRVMAEAEAWAEVRSALPGVPIILPTWLPPSVDRTRVELRELVRDPADPRYAIAYVAPTGATVVLALGHASGIDGSGIGTRVRNSPAVLSFSQSLWSEPHKPAPRRVLWVEDRYVLRVDSDRFTGDDLLHIAWSLDRTGQPALKYPYTRTKPGVCASHGAPPDATIRQLLTFVGNGDREAVLDCFSLEFVGQSPYPSIGGWADLPRASDFRLSPPSALAGRFVVSAGWLFARHPGGAWNQDAHHFFVLGLEDGSWRVYEIGTAMYGPPP
jgi:hypothetical protein